jgi:hypothetical protein
VIEDCNKEITNPNGVSSEVTRTIGIISDRVTPTLYNIYHGNGVLLKSLLPVNVCMLISTIVARQLVGGHFSAAINARNNRRIVGIVICFVKGGCVDLSMHPLIITR